MTDLAMSATIGKIADALAKAQAQMGHAAKDSANPHFKSRYADLASILDAVRGPLAGNGIAIVQMPSATSRGVMVSTMLAHTSGEWVSCALELPVSKGDAQGVGSAVTYGRRYTLAAICGIAQDDDDGNAAAKAAPPPPAPEPPPPPPKPPGVRETILGIMDLIDDAPDEATVSSLERELAPDIARLPAKARPRIASYCNLARCAIAGLEPDPADIEAANELRALRKGDK